MWGEGDGGRIFLRVGATHMILNEDTKVSDLEHKVDALGQDGEERRK